MLLQYLGFLSVYPAFIYATVFFGIFLAKAVDLLHRLRHTIEVTQLFFLLIPFRLKFFIDLSYFFLMFSLQIFPLDIYQIQFFIFNTLMIHFNIVMNLFLSFLSFEYFILILNKSIQIEDSFLFFHIVLGRLGPCELRQMVSDK